VPALEVTRIKLLNQASAWHMVRSNTLQDYFDQDRTRVLWILYHLYGRIHSLLHRLLAKSCRWSPRRLRKRYNFLNMMTQKHRQVRTVSLKQLPYQVIVLFTAPANCIEQRASQLCVICAKIKNQTKRVDKIMSIWKLTNVNQISAELTRMDRIHHVLGIL